MGQETGISWCTHTFNPWHGCTRVSEACRSCYAEAFANRTGHKIWGVQAPRRFFGDKHWNEPLKWNRDAEQAGVRARTFCASMADVFESRPDLDEHRARLWPLIEATPSLDWLLLTKRPEHIAQMLPAAWLDAPRQNVWLGTTTEDQTCADLRIPHLLQVQAVVHFLSVEPMLEPITFKPEWLGTVEGRALITWVITGGESGAKFRDMDHAWPRAVRDQCVAHGVAYYQKQSSGIRTGMGTWLQEPDGSRWTWHQFPRTPFNPAGSFPAPERVAA